MSSIGESTLKAIEKGDIVTRYSYNHDIYFKVVSVYTGDDGKEHALLKGLDIRLEATAPLDDLLIAEPAEIYRYCQQSQLTQMGKVECILKQRKLLSMQPE